VYVNGHLVGEHRGDYDSFSFDVTGFLHLGANELIVGFFDPIGDAGEPVGKQIPGAPYSFFHTAVSGIWQTVWLEPVASRHITGLQLTPELTRSSLVISASAAGGGRLTLLATALDGGRAVATATGAPGKPFALQIAQPREWSPWHPFLYGLHLELLDRGRVVDTVDSYFGMRSISLGRVAGAVRILLNGKFVFQAGALDQGYWPDGLYTPPADAAMRSDILAAKGMGFDMLREHEKVEPDRWYYWADRLGILVWQDMPSMSLRRTTAPTRAEEAEFRSELDRVVIQHRSDPSIVMWIPFNEGWGAFDPTALSRSIRGLAPGELVDSDSGSANCCGTIESPASDVRDAHLYAGPFAVAADYRASVVGEYGGVLPYPPAGHTWPGVLTSVGFPVQAWPAPPADELLRAQYAGLGQEMRTRGLSAAVFTELSADEQELGILTYDRRVYTMPPALIRALNAGLISTSQHLRSLPSLRPGTPPGADGAWTFSEGAGTIAHDGARHGQALTLNGGAGWGAGPVLGGRRTGAIAISGPGQAAVSSARVLDTSRSFTVSVWLRPAAWGQSGTAVSEPGPDGSSFSLGIHTLAVRRPAPSAAPSGLGPAPPIAAARWTFVVPGSSSCTSAQCGVEANLRYGDGRFQPRPGAWHQVTGVYDDGTQSIALYVDGELQDVEHVFGIPPAQGPLTVGQGSGDYAPTDFFDGAIGELRVYSRALNAAQVWQLYRAQTL